MKVTGIDVHTEGTAILAGRAPDVKVGTTFIHSDQRGRWRGRVTRRRYNPRRDETKVWLIGTSWELRP
jgi:hypothetical protein